MISSSRQLTLDNFLTGNSKLIFQQKFSFITITYMFPVRVLARHGITMQVRQSHISNQHTYTHTHVLMINGVVFCPSFSHCMSKKIYWFTIPSQKDNANSTKMSKINSCWLGKVILMSFSIHVNVTVTVTLWQFIERKSRTANNSFVASFRLDPQNNILLIHKRYSKFSICSPVYFRNIKFISLFFHIDFIE